MTILSLFFFVFLWRSVLHRCFAIYYFSVLFFYFGSVYGCLVEFMGRMFRFGLAWLVRSN